MTTLGKGQRMGLFAGSGVGKSSLLSMIARGTDAEVSVIALVGERGREVREFLEDDLGPAGLARSVVVVATSDEPALMRMRAAFTATRIAESFRDPGQDVVLMMDSLTRVAMAQREIGLSAGEPPATRGYPPSTFSILARLLERAGTAETGSVTGIYTVLVDGDDHNEPIADAARSILDGHVVLDRKLAVTGHFPSVDVLGSVSRVASKVNARPHLDAASALRRVMAARKAAQDLIDVGAYQAGTNPLVDAALAHEDVRQRVPAAADGRVHPPPRVLAPAGPPHFDPGSRGMNRQFSLAGLLRLRQIQQDQAASGLARARSRSSSVARPGSLGPPPAVRHRRGHRQLGVAARRRGVPLGVAQHARGPAEPRPHGRSRRDRGARGIHRRPHPLRGPGEAARPGTTPRSNTAELRAEQSTLDEISSTIWHRDEQQVRS